MLDTMDRETLRKRVVEIKDEYTQKILDHAYLDISCPSGVKEEPPEYTEMINFPKEELKKIDGAVLLQSGVREISAGYDKRFGQSFQNF